MARERNQIRLMTITAEDFPPGPYKAEPCPCGQPVCRNWLVWPVAALQGVNFTQSQAEAVTTLLNERAATMPHISFTDAQLERIADGTQEQIFSFANLARYALRKKRRLRESEKRLDLLERQVREMEALTRRMKTELVQIKSR